MIHIRRAGPLDSGAIAELLNEIIAIGGTTAYVEPFSTAAMSDRITASNSVWHLAENDAGALMGVQWFIPHPDIPADSASIATFVRIGETGLGIGSKLFVATCDAARAAGYRSLDAVIRADNEGGLAYYQSRGFEVIRRLPDMPLEDGTRVDKIWKRYNL